MSTVLSLRAQDSWFTLLDTLNDLVSSVMPENRSLLIREVLQREGFLWLDAPYIATSTNNFVFVSRDGDMYLLQESRLFLLDKREALPCRISMKPEKELEWERQFAEAQNFGDRIRSRWLINHFSAWDENPDDAIATHVDRLGITSKGADLAVGAPQGTAISREILVGNREYVQWGTEGDTQNDRAMVGPDIPTLNFSAAVMIDLDLYRQTMKRKHAQTDFQLRNQDHALMHTEKYLSDANANDWHGGREPGCPKRMEAHRDEVLERFKRFLFRLHQLADKKTVWEDGDKKPIVTPEARDRIMKVKRPKEFLFGLLKWPMPPVGLQVCLTWNKPDPLE